MKRLIVTGTLILSLAPFLALAQETASDPNTTEAPADTSFSSTYAFQRQGVFGCSLNGSYSMSVGAMGAVGGAFVPVNDAAVTLNTGYLVYKECVLRGIVDRMRENASSAFQKQIINAYESGRNGQPLFSQDIDAEEWNVRDQSVVNAFENGLLDSLNPALKGPVTRAIAQGYKAARTTPGSAFECPYTGNLAAVWSGRPEGNYWDGFSAGMNPACRKYSATTLASNIIYESAQNAVNNMMTQLQWGLGTYPTTAADPTTGRQRVVTPASIVSANTIQALQTGFKQLENANDIDQMVGALFAGITSHVLGDSRGLAGLIQKTGNQPSYLDQVAKESSQGLRDSALNAAIQILTASRQVEAAYKTAMDGIGNILVNTMGQLRTKESACWNLIIQKECATPLAADNTCTANVSGCTTDPTTGQQTCPTADKLKVATSTQYSQQVISSQITPLASTTAINIQASAKAIGLIQQLLTGVTNTTSLDAQRVALQQLDSLVAQKALHTQYDMQAAQQQQTDVTTSMATLIQDTVKAWADSTDPNTGWCNVNNQSVIDKWHQAWKQ